MGLGDCGIMNTKPEDVMGQNRCNQFFWKKSHTELDNRLQSHFVWLHSSTLEESNLKFRTEDVCLEQKYFQGKKNHLYYFTHSCKVFRTRESCVALGLKKQKMKLKQNEEQIPFLGRGEKGPSTTGEKEVWFYKFVPF